MDGQSVIVAGQSLSTWDVTRNNAGRIVEKAESIGGRHPISVTLAILYEDESQRRWTGPSWRNTSGRD